MASGDAIVEEPSGDIDGINRWFYTSREFEAGSVKLWLNGLLLRVYDDDGWTELSSIEIETKEPPRTGDSLHVRYTEK